MKADPLQTRLLPSFEEGTAGVHLPRYCKTPRRWPPRALHIGRHCWSTACTRLLLDRPRCWASSSPTSSRNNLECFRGSATELRDLRRFGQERESIDEQVLAEYPNSSMSLLPRVTVSPLLITLLSTITCALACPDTEPVGLSGEGIQATSGVPDRNQRPEEHHQECFDCQECFDSEDKRTLQEKKPFNVFLHATEAVGWFRDSGSLVLSPRAIFLKDCAFLI